MGRRWVLCREHISGGLCRLPTPLRERGAIRISTTSGSASCALEWSHGKGKGRAFGEPVLL